MMRTKEQAFWNQAFALFIKIRFLILGLRDAFRCIVPDHIGCSLSCKPQDYPYRLAERMPDRGRPSDRLQHHRICVPSNAPSTQTLPYMPLLGSLIIHGFNAFARLATSIAVNISLKMQTKRSSP